MPLCLDCQIYAYFNFPMEKSGVYCNKHKKEGMINIKSALCQFEEGCKTQATFGYEKSKAIRCSKHVVDGMYDVLHKLCEEDGCKTIPCCNYPTEKKGRFCKIHKKDGMFDVCSTKCKECSQSATFNYPGEPRMYCKKHATSDMIDVRHSKCADCGKNPSFGLKGTLKPTHCADHKTNEMEDLIHRRCKECSNRAFYNNRGEKTPLYCSEHAKDNMVNVIHRLCEMCNVHATYGFEETKPLRCKTHCETGMFDVQHEKCKTPLCDTRIFNPQYKGYCLRCFIYTFPNEPIVMNYKTKEQAVVDYIKKNFNQYDWVFDKQVKEGCSKRRPDCALDFGDKIIIVEVDENQHTSYDTTCENRRIMELFQDFGNRNIVFIRFNPDDYKTKTINIRGCWDLDGNGILVVKQTKQADWNNRLQTLNTTIQEWIEKEATKMVKIIELFYDE